MRIQSVRRDNRYSTRLDVKLNAALRELGSPKKFTIDIIDLSLTGLRFDTAFRLQVGQFVLVSIPGLAPLEAKVAWIEGFRYGAAFENALHVAVFDHLVSKYKKA